MTIEHLCVSHRSRGQGQTAVAAAAYISASKIVDERIGTTFDFRRKQGVEASFIVAPAGVPSEVPTGTVPSEVPTGTAPAELPTGATPAERSRREKEHTRR